MQSKFSKARIECIMESLGGLQPAVAPDFFYTRLKGKMQPTEVKKKIFMLRPAFITAALAVLFIANVISLLQADNKIPKQDAMDISGKPATIESFASAYNINTESVYE